MRPRLTEIQRIQLSCLLLFGIDRKWRLWVNLVQKIKIVRLSENLLPIYTNSNMQIWMVVFTFSAVDTFVWVWSFFLSFEFFLVEVNPRLYSLVTSCLFSIIESTYGFYRWNSIIKVLKVNVVTLILLHMVISFLST